LFLLFLLQLARRCGEVSFRIIPTAEIRDLSQRSLPAHFIGLCFLLPATIPEHPCAPSAKADNAKKAGIQDGLSNGFPPTRECSEFGVT